ncbi:MAG: pyridoxal kinase PdxY [Meiothermus sp.]|uniref:pyridoxal kinase PdxY n=1 Tax=Meiothermus sp. TaxID=1955249 RepID=UPI0025FDD6FB|nr:pyridoxal kinase PdxY [Meiothermus sp.]MCS7193590.1 pyridoxal kinase PdxY [Meiothermus sp.]MDW8090603.1 pyridoxal kinase PdxY [Meiothermus sp.]MDW8480519.1 pyridoxal kinase PdxY [Meiothermus sp.]
MGLPRSILSIQSWVAYGHVGNAAAVFPLQRLGFEVWAVHTVLFSNHTGYGAWRGLTLPPEHLVEMVEGIAERGALAQCDAVLSGYMGSAGTAAAILSALARVRTQNPQALFCCDPVMGDAGRGVFVHPEIPPVLKAQVLPQADLLTPNQFELELLSGRRVRNLEEALEAAHELRERMRPEGPRVVMVTSFLPEKPSPSGIETLAVGEEGAYRVRTPYIPLDPPRNGAGDAITALFLGHYLRTGRLALSLENAVSATYNLLQLTHQLGAREIQLVAAQEEYANPSQRFAAERVA